MTLATLIAAAAQDREGWKYTSLRGLSDQVFAPAAAVTVAAAALPPLLDAAGQRLVFVNGVFQAGLSSQAALPPDFMRGDAASGYRLTIPAQTCLAALPLELLCIAVKAAAAQQSQLRLAIDLGANARLTLLERHMTLGAGAAHAALVTLSATLAAQAKLLHLKFQQHDQDDYHLAVNDAMLAKGAYYDQFTMTTGAALSRNMINVTLAAPEAQTRLHGIYLLRGNQHGDTTTCISHAARGTTSQENYRGVLDGKARGVFQGKIIVAPQAQQTDGQQMSRALLLSDQAEANCKPELEIYADDVKCSHGATIGQLDEQALFYLRSRGVSVAAARAMLIAAFITELVEAVGQDAGRGHAMLLAEQWSGGQHP